MSDAAADKPLDEGRPLLFGWKGDPEFAWRVPLFIFGSLLFHAFAFYLFQVSYPPAERIAPEPMKVTLLHSENPYSARFLRDLDDRMFALTPGDSTDLPNSALSHPEVRFRPSFQDHEIPLKVMNRPDTEMASPSPLIYGGIIFPKTKAPVLQIDPENFESRLQVMVGSALNDRPFAIDQERFPFDIKKTSGRLQARVGVFADGRIGHFLIEEEPRGGLRPSDVAFLSQSIRFDPVDGEEVTWASITVQW